MHRGQVANDAGAYPGFCSMKPLRVFLLPPGWNASPSQGYPQHLPIYTPGWREVPWEKSFLPKNTTQWSRPALEPGPLDLETWALTMRPLRLPHFSWSSFHDKRSKMTIITANHTQGDGVKDQSKLWECAGKVTWNKCEGKARWSL